MRGALNACGIGPSFAPGPQRLGRKRPKKRAGCAAVSVHAGRGHHRSQCLTIAKALLRAAEPTTAASSMTVISRQLIMGLPAL
jgi:hypothetical protein